MKYEPIIISVANEIERFCMKMCMYPNTLANEAGVNVEKLKGILNGNVNVTVKTIERVRRYIHEYDKFLHDDFKKFLDDNHPALRPLAEEIGVDVTILYKIRDCTPITLSKANKVRDYLDKHGV